MNLIFALPLLLQGFIIAIDEFYFHYHRGLPPWERIGHPLDSLSLLCCYLFVLLAQATETNILIYAALSCLSCIFVTKDEFVHTGLCSKGENWLHALLFILHPICLYSIYRFWIKAEFQNLLLIQTVLIFSFMIYQFVFWQFFKREIK